MSEPKLRWCLFSDDEIGALENVLVFAECHGELTETDRLLLKEIEAYQKYKP